MFLLCVSSDVPLQKPFGRKSKKCQTFLFTFWFSSAKHKFTMASSSPKKSPNGCSLGSPLVRRLFQNDDYSVRTADRWQCAEQTTRVPFFYWCSIDALRERDRRSFRCFLSAPSREPLKARTKREPLCHRLNYNPEMEAKKKWNYMTSNNDNQMSAREFPTRSTLLRVVRWLKIISAKPTHHTDCTHELCLAPETIAAFSQLFNFYPFDELEMSQLNPSWTNRQINLSRLISNGFRKPPSTAKCSSPEQEKGWYMAACRTTAACFFVCDMIRLLSFFCII